MAVGPGYLRYDVNRPKGEQTRILRRLLGIARIVTNEIQRAEKNITFS
jgi:hypothetical protein